MIFTPTKLKEILINKDRLTAVLANLLVEVRADLQNELVSLKGVDDLEALMGMKRQIVASNASVDEAIDAYLKMVTKSPDLKASLVDLKDKEWLFNVIFTSQKHSDQYIGYTMRFNREMRSLIQSLPTLIASVNLGNESKDELKESVTALNDLNALQQYFVLHHLLG